MHIGDEFADAQGRSVVIAFDDGGPEPDISFCVLDGDTTTTSTITTTAPSTTTSTVPPTSYVYDDDDHVDHDDDHPAGEPAGDR